MVLELRKPSVAGTGATLARDVPFSALYWGMLEPIRHSLLPSDGAVPSKSKLLIANFVAGSLGGAAAAAITTPLVRFCCVHPSTSAWCP